jgi:hypothetical protein
MECPRHPFPTAAGWFFVRMKDRRPGRRPRSGRGAATHNQRPWIWVPATGVPATAKARLRASVTRYASRGAPRGDDPRRRNNADRIPIPIHFSNSPSRSRGAFSAPGFFTFASLTRIEGWAERRETFGCSAEHPWARHLASKTRVNALMTRRARPLARRLASHDAGRSPLGAPPWRFWASGPRFRLLRRPPSYNGGQLPSDPCSELLAARS